jgi:hypothetical protein
MQSTPNLRDTDPHDVFVIDPDVSLAARADKAPLDLLYDVLSRPSDPAPVRPDPELRIAPDLATRTSVPPVTVAPAPLADDTPVNDIRLGETEISAHQPRTGKLARRAVMGLFAVASATGAAAWQHYGDDAKAMLAQYAPPFAQVFSATPSKPAEPSAVQASATDQAAAQPATAEATSTAPDQTQTIQSMARDLAAMSQQITELKATVEQLKAAQQQPMANASPAANAISAANASPAASASPAVSPAARAAEARLTEPAPPITRPRIVPPPAHSTVSTLARRPKQTFPYQPIAAAPPPPQQAAAAAPPPMQIAPRAEDGGPVVRPPMPLQ